MRIIGGTLKGRRLQYPRKFKSRPTTDFARESLFNILGNQVDLTDCSVVDLFSGTGAITYEFASRGARSVLAIENNRFNVRFISRSLEELDIHVADVYNWDVFDWINQEKAKFEVVFADPPFDHPKLGELPGLIETSGIVAPGGIFVLEHPDSFSFDANPHFRDHRRYGGVNFTFFGGYGE